jgi:outer membrane protein OmpA-like peptidoglycan-associated protein
MPIRTVLLALFAALPAFAQDPPPNMRPGWERQTERVENGPEGALVVRVGDIDNLGFGWPDGYDPFSGRPGDAHPFPWEPGANDAPGTDRIMVGTGVRYPLDPAGPAGDGYHETVAPPASVPSGITIPVGRLPDRFSRVMLQAFVDDFQAPSWGSAFVVTLNGQRLEEAEVALNALDQTGPVGKLLTFVVPPAFHALLATGTLEFRVDDPVTGARDGFAFDFVRLLVDPRFPVPAAVRVTAVDAETGAALPGVAVSALDLSGRTGADGTAVIGGLPGGLMRVAGSLAGYESGSAMADLITGETGEARIELRRLPPPPRPAAQPARPAPVQQALREQLQREGRVVLRGIHFDTDSAIPRADSRPELEALLALVRETGETPWIIEGHTDSTGSAGYNRGLSARRALSVIDVLERGGIPPGRLQAVGFGPDRPVGDNTTAEGRALNRRVEARPIR